MCLTTTETQDEWIDTVGRHIAKPATLEMYSDVSQCPTMPSGATAPMYSRQWTIPGYSSPFILCYTSINVETQLFGNVSPGGIFLETTDPNTYAQVWLREYGNPNQLALQSIVRPDGTSWRFVFDSAPSGSTNIASYGNITRIIEPTGGSIYYCYAMGTGLPLVPYTTVSVPFLTGRAEDSSPQSINSSFDCSHPQQLTATQAFWNYGAVNGFLTVTSPPRPGATQGDDTVYIVGGPPYGMTPWSNHTYQNTITKYNGPVSNGQVVSTITRTYQANLIPDTSDPGTTNVEGNNVLLSTKEVRDGVDLGTAITTYDSTFIPAVQTCVTGSTSCVLSSVLNTGIGQAYILTDPTGTTTNTTFRWKTDNNFASSNLIDLPSSSVTSDATSSNEDDYAYDEAAYLAGLGIGHQTGVTHVNPGGVSVTEHSHFDMFGAIDGRFDGKLQPVSQVSAWDSYHLFPTAVANLVGTEHFSYDPNNGNLLSHTDLNGRTTTYFYDGGARLTGIQNPGLSGTALSQATCYPDANTQIRMQAQTSPVANSSADGITCPSAAEDTIVNRSQVDGLGNLTYQTLVSNPGGSAIVRMDYDLLGNMWHKSNPYIQGGALVQSTYLYDAIGRLKEVDFPDGISSIHKAYAGFVETDIDENGNETTIQADARGRVVSALEPTAANTAPTVATQYTYNVFGLTSVTQSGQSGETARYRSFNYNPLGQIITFGNSETGTICYGLWSGGSPGSGVCQGGYDLNGNLLYKTDARGATTSYHYDSSNRIMGKTYSVGNDTGATLASCYSYDTAPSGSANGNFIGRLAQEWTIAGTSCTTTPPSTGYQTLHSILQYDPMGRVKKEQQCHGTTCSTNAPYTLLSDYDLAGNVMTYTNGVRGIKLTSTYDSSGRQQSLGSSWVDSTHPGMLFSGPGYTPAGALQKYSLGTGINVTKTYDNRLRTTGETASQP